MKRKVVDIVEARSKRDARLMASALDRMSAEERAAFGRLFADWRSIRRGFQSIAMQLRRIVAGWGSNTGSARRGAKR
jgi:hypothetical protein